MRSQLDLPLALVAAGLLLRGAVSVLLAGLLVVLHRRYPRPHLRTWAAAWACYAVAQVGGLVSIELQLGEAPDAVLRAIAWSADSVFLYGAGVLVVVGAWELRRARRVAPRWRWGPLAATAAFGLTHVLLTASPSVSNATRGAVNVGGRSLLLAVALFGAAAWVHRGRGPLLGPRVVAFGMGLLGAAELAVVLAVGARLVAIAVGREVASGAPSSGSIPVVFYALPLLGVVAVCALGLGMLLWLLEEEQARAARLLEERAEAERQRAALVDQLRQAQKMEAVGRLAGGVTHDLKNLLGVIGAWLPDLRSVDAADREEGLAAVDGAYRRALGLSRQLLSFARQQPVAPRRVDLGDVVREVSGLVAKTLPQGATVKVESASPCPVVADPDQLVHVFMNLALNARDALGRRGRIVLRTRLAEHAAEAPMGPDLAPAGRYAVVDVEDDGTGMDEAVLQRLFEPFFTTKDAGKGAGLGLSTAYGIVRQAGGYVAVRSAPGQGSTFSVALPWAEEARGAPPGDDAAEDARQAS